MTGDRGNDRDNQKIVGLGCLGRNSFITTIETVSQKGKEFAGMACGKNCGMAQLCGI